MRLSKPSPPPGPLVNVFTFDNDPTLSLKSYDFLAFELSGYVEGQFATYELSNISVNSDIVTQQTNTSQTDAPSLISFSIGNDTYQAEEGMTWLQFVNSNYNNGDFQYNEQYNYIYSS